MEELFIDDQINLNFEVRYPSPIKSVELNLLSRDVYSPHECRITNNVVSALVKGEKPGKYTAWFKCLFSDDSVRSFPIEFLVKDRTFDDAINIDTLEKMECTICEDITEHDAILTKSLVHTPMKDGKVDYNGVETGDTIWVTVTHGTLAGRHIMITKRPDGLFAVTGGSAAKYIQDKYGISTPTSSLRHLVMGGTPKKNPKEEQIDIEAEEKRNSDAPLEEKKKELLAEAKKDADATWKEFQASIGADDNVSLTRLKAQREDLIKDAMAVGLSEPEAVAYSTSIIRHVAAINKQVHEQRSHDAGVREMNFFSRMQAMKDENASPETIQDEIKMFQQGENALRGGVQVAVPNAAAMQGLAPGEIESKVANYLDEKATETLNPNPTDATLDAELKAEGNSPIGTPLAIPTVEIAPEMKPIVINDIDALEDSVNKFREYHQKQAEINAVKHLIKPKTFAQVTPAMLEQMVMEVKEIAPQATDEDIQEIEKSYEDTAQQNNSAMAFYHALGEYWNDNHALTQTENRVDNGFGQYVNSGATSALAALTGSYFLQKVEAAKLIEKTNIETAALVTAYKLREQYKNDVSKYNVRIQAIADYNSKNQEKTEQAALERNKVLKTRYDVIQSEKAKGTLTSQAFLVDKETSNLISQKENLGNALGSMQASAAFLEALIVARDAKDRAISIDFGKDRAGAAMRMNELKLGDKAQIDDADPKHIKIVTTVKAIQRFANEQDIISEKNDINEKIKNNMTDLETDSEGNNHVVDGTYHVPFWKDTIEFDGKEQKHYFRVEQRNDIEWLKKNGGGVITHPTGAGKTNSILGFFANKIAEDPNYVAMITVPKGRVGQWVEEAHRFTTLPIVEVPEGMDVKARAALIHQLKPGQIAVISHHDAVYSYYDIEAEQNKKGLFKGIAIDEPQELVSKSSRGNMSAAARKLMHLDIDNRIAATATPAKMNLVESYDLVNWASHHDKSLGPRARFQRVYGGYGAGTNAQDSTMQQMVFREISPYISGNRLTNSTFKVKQDIVHIAKTPIQDDNMRQIESGTDTFVTQEKDKFIHSIEQNPELLTRWEKKGRDWRRIAGSKASEKAKTALMTHHWDNLQGTYGDKMQWKDNPKLVETAKYISSNPTEKHIIFVDNYSQRKAMTQALMEGGLKDGTEIINIAGTPEVTKRAISGADMAKRVATFQRDKNAKVIFIDRASASGYNLQSADVLHVIGTPSDAANYLQAQGRAARMPRFGDVKVRTYRYTDAPFEDDKWDSIDTQLKMLKATAPAMFFKEME